MVESGNLFTNKQPEEPLAARMRPRNFNEFVGQGNIVAPGAFVRNLIEKDQLSSLIFFGPAGTGKTTLASIIAGMTKARFVSISAVASGLKELKEIETEAQKLKSTGQKTILFIDEIHRFNKAQQDALLPIVEDGTVILIGATTENPSFEINSALLSRSKVIVFQLLNDQEVKEILTQAMTSSRGYGDQNFKLTDEQLQELAGAANGDARTALNLLEMLYTNANHEGNEVIVTPEVFNQILSGRQLRYDKNGEEFYNLISALHKSMRNSDDDAALYWLARLLEGGADPLYVARRVVRFASEDVGLADSNALNVAINAFEACKFIGMPECSVHLSHAVVYCALSPKSNALENAYNEAKSDVKDHFNDPVPLAIRNAPTKLMKELNYGAGYKYAHNYEDKITDLDTWPETLPRKTYFRPGDSAGEKRFKERKDWIRAWHEKHDPRETK
ncbi:replication-associated recombination protein A [Xylocopilactobacillus apicola]|uniref:Replication-associated recombination protein A n=1 Tax=Xylocopilactobacillus apicola TaxID=2932184 RepID=A0AAU9D848_9LACO|nr:replication-associated recombination protein A [Xylocopilactobacillus apicola]BDR59728.1 ATPase AAA [Xylocopilactobacillus apicola]